MIVKASSNKTAGLTGAALLVASMLTLSACGGGGSDSPAPTNVSPNPPAAPAPGDTTPNPGGTTPAPGTPAPVTPAPANAVPTGFKEVTAATAATMLPAGAKIPADAKLFFKDTNNDGKVSSKERVIVMWAKNNHYYEVVRNVGADIASQRTRANAVAAAKNAGGALFTAEGGGGDLAELTFVRDALKAEYRNAPAPDAGGEPGELKIGGGEAMPEYGAWVGLTHVPGNPTIGWKWDNGVTAATDFTQTSPAFVNGWNGAGQNPGAADTFGAIASGLPTPTPPNTASSALYGITEGATGYGLPVMSVVEYDAVAKIK